MLIFFGSEGILKISGVANLCLHVKNYLIKLIYAKSFLFYINRYPIQYYPGYPEAFLLLMILPGK